MTTKTARVAIDGDGLRLTAETGSGHRLILDDAAGNAGPRPAELLLVSQAGCTAMDVISILRKKRQVVERYEVRVRGLQRDDPQPHVFERIDIVHVVEGPHVDVTSVRRAVELSATQYCTVTGNLAAGPAEIHHGFLLRSLSGGTADERYEEVVVTGPWATTAKSPTGSMPGPAPARG